MFVVAHPDDDLLFMNPNLASSLRAGHCIFTVYLTTGANPGGVAGYNATYGTSITPAQYAAKREAGILAAYAQMAGVKNVWWRGTLRLSGGKTVAAAVLQGNPRVVLAFLRLPEAADRAADPSLTTLDELYFQPGRVITSADGATYTADQLVGLLALTMSAIQPKYLHIQDSEPDPFIRDESGNTVGDHIDHILGARFALEAEARYPGPHTLIRYRDYNTNAENTPNLSDADVAEKSRIFGAYAQHDMLICPPGAECTNVARFPGWMPGQYQGWLRRQYFNVADDQEGSVLRNGAGLLHVFMTGDRTSTVRSLRQGGAGGSSFGAWSDLGGNFSAKPVVTAAPNGGLTAFVQGSSGALFYSEQAPGGGGWSAWRSLGGHGVSDPAVTLDPTNRSLQLFVVDRGGEILTSTGRPGGGWSGWKSLSGRFPDFEVWSNPSAARLPSGRTTLFVRDDRGNVRYTTQKGSGQAWDAWTVLGQGFRSDPVAVPGAGGRIDLFMRGDDGGLYTRQQNDRGAWTPWRKLEYGALQFSGQPIVANAPDGRTEVFVRDVDTSIVRFTRPSPTGAWAVPERLATDVRAISILGAEFDGSGALHLVARGTDGQVYSTLTRAASGGWTPWANLGH